MAERLALEALRTMGTDSTDRPDESGWWIDTRTMEDKWVRYVPMWGRVAFRACVSRENAEAFIKRQKGLEGL